MARTNIGISEVLQFVFRFRSLKTHWVGYICRCNFCRQPGNVRPLPPGRGVVVGEECS